MSPAVPKIYGVPALCLWRAHVSAVESCQPEITAFVRAGSRGSAVLKIASTLAVLEYRKVEDVQERIYNCSNAFELISEGLSDDHAVRIFETGWSDRVLSWVESPLVLLTDPAPLLRAWACIPKGEFTIQPTTTTTESTR